MKDMKFMKGGKERVQEGSKEHRAESIGKTTTATAPFRVQEGEELERRSNLRSSSNIERLLRSARNTLCSMPYA
ncbi:MAG TPA: hypothetical protein PLI51_10935, partial [bacterium]|nr:hypothetical protein [bacterium]